MPFTENPPWSDRILREHMDEIEESGFPAPKCAGRKRGPCELGAGRYGAVYRTEDPFMVFKITSDPSEVRFVQRAMGIGEWPEGIVRYEAVIEFEETFRKRPTYGIWREAAFLVGLQDGAEEVKHGSYDWLNLNRFWNYLYWFGRNADLARSTLRRAQDPLKSLEKARSLEEWAWRRVGEEDAMPKSASSGFPRSQFLAMRYAGPERVAIALRACEYVAEAMEHDNPASSHVGAAMAFYLQHGILLADVHSNNVGQVKRRDEYGEHTYWVITDPGHAVFFEEI